MHYILYETLYFIEKPLRTLGTQAVVTSSSGRTLCTSGSCLVHAAAAAYDVAGRTVVTHVVLIVPAGRRVIRRESAANVIRVGPHYLGVVTCS